METNFEQHSDISYHNTRAAILAILKLIRLTFWPKIHCEVWQFRHPKNLDRLTLHENQCFFYQKANRNEMG